MIRQYREKNPHAPTYPALEVYALEWNSHRPYESLSILANWAGPGANGCYLDGLERGQDATGILVFRSAGGLVSVADGDFITKFEGQLVRHDRKSWLGKWELLKETTEDRVAL